MQPLLMEPDEAVQLPLCAQDHFRKVCTPNYVNVFRDRGGVIGVVEFDTPEDLSRAVRPPWHDHGTQHSTFALLDDTA